MSWSLKSSCLLFVFGAALTAIAAEKDHVVVVYNPRLQGSEELAEYYAEKRGLSDDQLIGIDCTPNEAISRAEFVEFIQKPLISKLEKEGWWKIRRDGADWKLTESRLKYLVLCHGIPLKITEEKPETPPKTKSPLQINGAAVDSELALLPSPKAPVDGFLPNPIFQQDGIDQFKEWNLQMILVTRLDGPNPAVCKRLVDGAIAGEKLGVWGRAVIDTRGITNGAYAGGDQWLNGLADFLERQGWHPHVDSIESIITDPGPFESTAIYAGWYADSISGPPSERKFSFMPGAVAYHIHSFSAQSVRTFDQKWVGPLVARGVAATMGCVEEPFLQFTPAVDVFFKQLIFGKNFAEAAYLSQPMLSWQITCVGDPLYRPFGTDLFAAVEEMEARNDPNLPWAHVLKARRMAASGSIDPAIELLAAADKARPNVLYQEGLAGLYALKKDHDASIKAWKQCVERAATPAARAYNILRLARQEWDAGRTDEAVAHYRQYLKEYPAHPMRFAVCVEARDKTTVKGMKADAEFFDGASRSPPGL